MIVSVVHILYLGFGMLISVAVSCIVAAVVNDTLTTTLAVAETLEGGSKTSAAELVSKLLRCRFCRNFWISGGVCWTVCEPGVCTVAAWAVAVVSIADFFSYLTSFQKSSEEVV